MDNLVFPCLACLIIGALSGFAAGFRLATMIRLGPVPATKSQPLQADPDLAEDFA